MLIGECRQGFDMTDTFETTLEWTGEEKIGRRLDSLIPDGFQSEITQIDDGVKLSIQIKADNLEELRQIVDELLTLFSDQDE